MTDLLVARAAFRDALRPKRLIIALLLILLPSALGLLWRSLTPTKDWAPDTVYDNLVTALVFGFTLTILSVVNGTGIVSQEIEQRTIVYLLTRPLPRWRILLAKFVVTYVVISVISVVTTLLLALVVFGPSHFAEAGVGPDIRALLVGAFAYGSIFLLLGTVLPRPLIYGLLFVFGWESWVPSLPGSLGRVSVMAYLRVLASRDITDTAASGDTSGGGILASLSKPPSIDISSKEALILLAAISVISLVLAMVIFSNREYVPREDAE